MTHTQAYDVLYLHFSLVLTYVFLYGTHQGILGFESILQHLFSTSHLLSQQ